MATYTDDYEEAVKRLDHGESEASIATAMGVSRTVIQRFHWIHDMGRTVEAEFRRIGSIPDILLRQLVKAQTDDAVAFGDLWTTFLNGKWEPPAREKPVAPALSAYTIQFKKNRKTHWAVVIAESEDDAVAVLRSVPEAVGASLVEVKTVTEFGRGVVYLA